ncbi:hypothetical protein [Clostridium ganghwense]|uniref:Lipoprotein n=1 Tax=Clostridium ganghwense TaxID=312089 RepID=A0ABT4CLR3_9CLOT|nr:hypothetical protein [Clostridium ganghwense]MCY6369985.1 hypothetical protein [Clostridium ganghwense]
MKRKLFIGVCIMMLLTSCGKSQNICGSDIKNEHSASDIGSIKSSELLKDIKSSKEQEDIMNEFNKLINNKDISEKIIINFVDSNIKGLSKDKASKLVLGIEQVQQKNYEKRIQSAFTGDIQTKIAKDFMDKKSITVLDNIKNLDNVKDIELKKYLSEILECGYKIITTEGQYYPIQNYEYLKKYNGYVTDDIKEYIEIAAVDSNQPPTSDAALIISWDEVFRRAIRSEDFLKKYPTSIKSKKIKENYLFYAATYLYGTNNSPDFDYINNKLSNKVLESYKNVSSKYAESDLSKIIEEYIVIIKKNNYTLTDEVENYRKNALNSLEKLYKY